jgi:hypothetical protein
MAKVLAVFRFCPDCRGQAKVSCDIGSGIAALITIPACSAVFSPEVMFERYEDPTASMALMSDIYSDIHGVLEVYNPVWHSEDMGLGHLRIPSEPPPLVQAHRSSDDSPPWSPQLPTPLSYLDEDSEMADCPEDITHVVREGPHLGTSSDRAEDSDIAASDLDPWSFEMLCSEDRKARIKDISQRDKDRGKCCIYIISLSATHVGIQRMPTRMRFARTWPEMTLSYLTTLSPKVGHHISCTCRFWLTSTVSVG